MNIADDVLFFFDYELEKTNKCRAGMAEVWTASAVKGRFDD